MPKSKFVVWGLVSAGAALTSAGYLVYRRQRKALEASLAQGSQVIQTGRGLVECAVVGQGPAVLVLHGGGGGYPSSLVFAEPQRGLQFIAPSRPGYLRTPLETGRSPEEQADAFAALLDALGIEKAGVWGMSGGGPPAIQFALRHPERCWGLVLLSAINQPVPPWPPAMQIIVRTLGMPDFFPWLLLGTRLRDLLAGKKFWEQVGSSPEKRQMYHRMMDTMYLLSRHLPGVLNDLDCIQAPVEPLEAVRVPTLVIHGDSDTVVPFANGQRAAQSIPGAQFFVIPEGDHLCYITHLEVTRPAVYDFLLAHAPQAQEPKRSRPRRKKSPPNPTSQP